MYENERKKTIKIKMIKQPNVKDQRVKLTNQSNIRGYL